MQISNDSRSVENYAFESQNERNVTKIFILKFAHFHNAVSRSDSSPPSCWVECDSSPDFSGKFPQHHPAEGLVAPPQQPQRLQFFVDFAIPRDVLRLSAHPLPPLWQHFLRVAQLQLLRTTPSDSLRLSPTSSHWSIAFSLGFILPSHPGSVAFAQ